jgi:hypothetical protein
MHLHVRALQVGQLAPAGHLIDHINGQQQQQAAGEPHSDVQHQAGYSGSHAGLASWWLQGSIRKLQQQQYTVVDNTATGSGSTAVVTYTMVLPCASGCVTTNKIQTQVKNFINQQVSSWVSCLG